MTSFHGRPRLCPTSPDLVGSLSRLRTGVLNRTGTLSQLSGKRRHCLPCGKGAVPGAWRVLCSAFRRRRGIGGCGRHESHVAVTFQRVTESGCRTDLTTSRRHHAG